MGTEGKATPNAEAAKRLASNLDLRNYDDGEFPADSRDLTVYTVTRMLESFPLLQTIELERRYSELDTLSREYISDVLVGYSEDLFLPLGRTKSQIAAHIIAATIAAPIFSGYKGRQGITTSTALAESLALNVSYCFKMEPDTINWDNREIITYTLGSALIVAAGRRDSASFDNVIWLGRNSQKLILLIDQIAQVSAEREYLEPLMQEPPNPLNGGAI